MGAPRNALGRGFLRDERGVAILEAAFIFPIMVMILALIVIWGQAYDIKRKVYQSVYSVTDIVANEGLTGNGGAVSQAQLDADLQLAASTMLPFTDNNTGPLSMVVTEFKADANGVVGTVLWSEAQFGGVARAAGTTITLPTGLVAANGYVLLGEGSYTYTPLNIGFIPVTTMVLRDTVYLAPRVHRCIPTYSYNPGLNVCN